MDFFSFSKNEISLTRSHTHTKTRIGGSSTRTDVVNRNRKKVNWETKRTIDYKKKNKYSEDHKRMQHLLGRSGGVNRTEVEERNKYPTTQNQIKNESDVVAVVFFVALVGILYDK